MPRKKTLDKPVSNLEVKAKKPTTTKKKVAPTEPGSLSSELSSVLGEDVSLVFRARQEVSEAPVRAVRGRSTPAKKTSIVAAKAKPDSTNWDEELPIPSFRSKSDQAPPTREANSRRNTSLAPSLTPTSPPEARPAGRGRTPRREAPTESFESFATERPSRRDDEQSVPAREFEPTAVLEFDDDGESVMVKMRERGEAPVQRTPVARTQSRTTLSNRTVTEPVTKKEPERVVIPPRALIDIPVDAPQIVMRKGVPTLVRESRVYPNFWFYAAPPDEDRVTTVLQEIRQAAESGVHVFCLGVEAVCDKHHFDALFDRCKTLIARIVKIDSDAQIVFHLDLVAPKGWEIDFPEGVYRDSRGDLAEPSLSDDKFWSHTEGQLRNFTKQLLSSPNAGHILGFDIDRDGWTIAENQSHDISIASKQKFREWVRERYQDDVVLLRASWFNGTADFESVRIPDVNQTTRRSRLIEADRKERPVVDYHLFLSDLTAKRISDLAYAVKESSEGRFLVGTRYGKTFENFRPNSGHLSLGKILRTPEIDFISASPSNKNRQASGVSSFEVPIDSISLNNKLFVSLEDYKTSLSNRPEPELGAPTIRTPQALEAVHRRGFGGSCAHQSGICWSDQWGNGWLTAASVWERAKAMRDLAIKAMSVESRDPDVAVFIDERTLGYLVNVESFGQLIEESLESIGRAGVSYGLYLLSDLAHRVKFPECKVYVFLNAWDIRPDLRSAIKQRLHKDGKLLFWVYSAGLFDNGRESIERAREVTGIAIKPQPIFSKAGTAILDRRNILAQAFPSNSIQTPTTVEPTSS